MKILIVSATTFEIAPLFEQLGLSVDTDKNFYQAKHQYLSIHFLITGVGMVATAYHTTRALLTTRYDLVLNVGVCGSFNSNLEIGCVVNVYKDCLSELGAESGEEFLSLAQMQLPGIAEVESSEVFNNVVLEELPKVNGITVNTTHGNQHSIDKVFNYFHPIVESMEGAAFMMVCKAEKVSYMQIRAVSNFVEPRNKNNWNMPLAITNLNKKVWEALLLF